MIRNNFVDYSNTIIYKIYCKNTAIKDVYVGHTTNFERRKYDHMTSSHNVKNTVKLYTFIRENGGWSNWKMVKICKYNCSNVLEARKMELKHYILCKATLNSNVPCLDRDHNNEHEISNSNDSESNHCESHDAASNKFESNDSETNKCESNDNETNKCESNNIVSTNVVDENKLSADNVNGLTKKVLFCKYCNFTSSKLSNFTVHCETKKHLKQKKNAEDMIPTPTSKLQCQICKREYKYSSGLWRHKKHENCHADKTSCKEKGKSKISGQQQPSFDPSIVKLFTEQMTVMFKEMIQENNVLLCKTLTTNSEL